MASQDNETTPPKPATVSKVQQASLLDSPSRLTRYQLRRMSVADASPLKSSEPQPATRRPTRGRQSVAGCASEDSDAVSVHSEPGGGGKAPQRRSTRASSQQPRTPPKVEVKRTRRSSVSSVTAPTVSVRSTRARPKLSPVPAEETSPVKLSPKKSSPLKLDGVGSPRRLFIDEKSRSPTKSVEARSPKVDDVVVPMSEPKRLSLRTLNSPRLLMKTIELKLNDVSKTGDGENVSDKATTPKSIKTLKVDESPKTPGSVEDVSPKTPKSGALKGITSSQESRDRSPTPSKKTPRELVLTPKSAKMAGTPERRMEDVSTPERHSQTPSDASDKQGNLQNPLGEARKKGASVTPLGDSGKKPTGQTPRIESPIQEVSTPQTRSRTPINESGKKPTGQTPRSESRGTQEVTTPQLRSRTPSESNKKPTGQTPRNESPVTQEASTPQTRCRTSSESGKKPSGQTPRSESPLTQEASTPPTRGRTPLSESDKKSTGQTPRSKSPATQGGSTPLTRNRTPLCDSGKKATTESITRSPLSKVMWVSSPKETFTSQGSETTGTVSEPSDSTDGVQTRARNVTPRSKMTTASDLEGKVATPQARSVIPLDAASQRDQSPRTRSSASESESSPRFMQRQSQSRTQSECESGFKSPPARGSPRLYRLSPCANSSSSKIEEVVDKKDSAGETSEIFSVGVKVDKQEEKKDENLPVEDVKTSAESMSKRTENENVAGGLEKPSRSSESREDSEEESESSEDDAAVKGGENKAVEIEDGERKTRRSAESEKKVKATEGKDAVSESDDDSDDVEDEETVAEREKTTETSKERDVESESSDEDCGKEEEIVLKKIAVTEETDEDSDGEAVIAEIQEIEEDEEGPGLSTEDESEDEKEVAVKVLEVESGEESEENGVEKQGDEVSELESEDDESSKEKVVENEGVGKEAESNEINESEDEVDEQEDEDNKVDEQEDEEYEVVDVEGESNEAVEQEDEDSEIDGQEDVENEVVVIDCESNEVDEQEDKDSEVDEQEDEENEVVDEEGEINEVDEQEDEDDEVGEKEDEDDEADEQEDVDNDEQEDEEDEVVEVDEEEDEVDEEEDKVNEEEDEEEGEDEAKEEVEMHDYIKGLLSPKILQKLETHKKEVDVSSRRKSDAGISKVHPSLCLSSPPAIQGSAKKSSTVSAPLTESPSSDTSSETRSVEESKKEGVAPEQVISISLSPRTETEVAVASIPSSASQPNEKVAERKIWKRKTKKRRLSDDPDTYDFSALGEVQETMKLFTPGNVFLVRDKPSDLTKKSKPTSRLAFVVRKSPSNCAAKPVGNSPMVQYSSGVWRVRNLAVKKVESTKEEGKKKKKMKSAVGSQKEDTKLVRKEKELSVLDKNDLRHKLSSIKNAQKLDKKKTQEDKITMVPSGSKEKSKEKKLPRNQVEETVSSVKLNTLMSSVPSKIKDVKQKEAKPKDSEVKKKHVAESSDKTDRKRKADNEENVLSSKKLKVEKSKASRGKESNLLNSDKTGQDKKQKKKIALKEKLSKEVEILKRDSVPRRDLEKSKASRGKESNSLNSDETVQDIKQKKRMLLKEKLMEELEILKKDILSVGDSLESGDDEAPTAVSFSDSRRLALQEESRKAAFFKEKSRIAWEKRQRMQLKREQQRADKLKRNADHFDNLFEQTRLYNPVVPNGAKTYFSESQGGPHKSFEETGPSKKKHCPEGTLVGDSKRERKQDDRDKKRKQKGLAELLKRRQVMTSSFIPVDTPSGSTRFGVVPLKNLHSDANRIADGATDFRSQMLYGNRVPRVPNNVWQSQNEKKKAGNSASNKQSRGK